MSRKRKTTESKDSLEKQIEKKRRVVQEAKTHLQESEADLAKLEEKQRSESKKTVLDQAKVRLAAERVRVLRLDDSLKTVDGNEYASQFYRTIKECIETFAITGLEGQDCRYSYYHEDSVTGKYRKIICDFEIPMTARSPAINGDDSTELDVDLHEYYFNEDTGFGFKRIVKNLDESVWLAALLAQDHLHRNDINLDSVTLAGVCDYEQAASLKQLGVDDDGW